MALSFCPNWESLQHLNSEMLSCSSSSSCSFQQPVQFPQLPEDLFSFNNGFEVSETLINPFIQPSDDLDLVYSDSHANLLSDSDSVISLTSSLLPLEDFKYSYPLPKRQKSYADDYNTNFTHDLLHGYVPNIPPVVEELLPAMIPASPTDFRVPAPATLSYGKTDQNVKQVPNGSTSLSVQSIAARGRRRKIAEKTQELGKLIPGGHRMNTAEMFQAASKYVKFLQAQVKILQLMESKQEGKELPLFHGEEVQALLGSTIIQEKLYSEEKCLIPKEFAETLANYPEIQSKPTIVDDIDQLLRTDVQS